MHTIIMLVCNDIMAGKVPGDPLNKMESCKFLIVILSWILLGTKGNQSPISICYCSYTFSYYCGLYHEVKYSVDNVSLPSQMTGFDTVLYRFSGPHSDPPSCPLCV